jgi:hypothetical protein
MKTKTIIRLATAVLLAVTLAGCVVVPYGRPYHHPHCGYYRCR